MDHYELLEVHPRASSRAVSRAYRDLTRRYHPDVYPPEKRAWAHAKMTEIAEAYRVLGDPTLRSEYDKQLGGGPAPSTTSTAKRDRRQTRARSVNTCARHQDQRRTASCMVCGASMCTQCRRMVGVTVCCPECEPRLAQKEAAAAQPLQTGPHDRVRPWVERLVGDRWGLTTGWGLIRGSLALALAMAAMGLAWMALGFRMFALSKAGDPRGQAAMGFAIGTLCGVVIWAALASARAWRHTWATAIVLLAFILIGAVPLTTLLRNHVRDAHAAVQAGQYRSAIISYAMAEWTGQLVLSRGSRQDVGDAYLALGLNGVGTENAEAARGALHYLGPLFTKPPSDRRAHGELFACFQLVANHFDAPQGRTRTWDDAVMLWKQCQQARPQDAWPYYYEGLSELGRLNCLQKRPSVFARRVARRGVDEFYELTIGLRPQEVDRLFDGLEDSTPVPQGSTRRLSDVELDALDLAEDAFGCTVQVVMLRVVRRLCAEGEASRSREGKLQGPKATRDALDEATCDRMLRSVANRLPLDSKLLPAMESGFDTADRAGKLTPEERDLHSRAENALGKVRKIREDGGVGAADRKR